MKTFIHIIPNLENGGAENFLMRLIPFLHCKHYVVTFINDSKSTEKLVPFSSVTHISLTSGIGNFFLLLRLIASLGKDDRILSWLHVSDSFASLLSLATLKNRNLVWNIRNTSIAFSSYSLATKLCFFVNIFFSYIAPYKIAFNSITALNQFKHLGYNKSKLIYIPNGYIVSQPHYASSFDYSFSPTLTLCCVARFHPQKKHSLLFEILSYLSESLNFTLHLVGPGISSSNATLKSLLIKYNLESKVILHSELEQSEVFSLLKNIDVSILASTSGESFPNFIAESMLCGCYPVCFDVGDSKTIVSTYGKCFPVDTPAKYIASFIEEINTFRSHDFFEWKNDRQLRSSHIIANYSIDTIASLYSNL